MSVGIGVNLVGHEWSSQPKHGKDYLSHNRNTLLLGAWTNQTGKPGKLPGFCSARWKVDAIDRYLSHKFSLTKRNIKKWIGFSLDEWRRSQRIMAGKEGQKGLIRLPLVRDVPLTRQQAIQEVEKMGWPLPPRSRCWMCPNQTDDEWLDLKLNHSKEFEKAIDFEKEMQLFDPLCWLHKSCIPLNMVNFSIEPTLFDTGQYCDTGICFV